MKTLQISGTWFLNYTLEAGGGGGDIQIATSKSNAKGYKEKKIIRNDKTCHNTQFSQKIHRKGQLFNQEGGYHE
jgi:hypothetical protein